MQVFKTQKPLYIKNQFIVWGYWFLAVFIFIILNLSFSLFTKSTLIAAVLFLLFSIMLDIFKEYHVEQIKINPNDNEIIIVLKSKLYGKKHLTYTLNDITSSFITKDRKYLPFNSGILLIYLPDKKYFKINNKYGFKTEALQEIHSLIEKGKESKRTWAAYNK